MYCKGWGFGPPMYGKDDIIGLVEVLYSKWLFVRKEYLAPPLQFMANVCIVLFLIQSVDRLVLMFGCFWIKFRKVRPIAKMVYEEKEEEGGRDVEVGSGGDNYPMVLLQIPMCNEREVSK